MKTSKEIEDKIIDDYLKGIKLNVITNIYSKDRKTIWSILKRRQVRRDRIIKDNTTRFINNINNYLYSNDECWMWLGKKDAEGYGIMSLEGKRHRAHRLSYLVHKAYEPKEYEIIMHKCDNPSCVNPFHLEIGTLQDNNKDKQNKNRQAKGQQIASSKLTEDQAIYIKYSDNDNRFLAKQFNISLQCIWMIKNNINWRHI